MRTGGGIESFPAVLFDKYGLKITRVTVYNWAERHEEFGEAKDLGTSLSFMFYENLAKRGMSGQLSRVVKETHVLDEKGQPVLDPKTDKPLIDREFDKTSFNAASWIFTMKNKFNWTDKHQHSGGEGATALPALIMLPENGRESDGDAE